MSHSWIRRCLWLFVALLAAPLAAQQPMDPPPLTPLPLPPRPQRDAVPLKRDPRIHPESDLPWGLPDGLARQLAQQAEVYREYAVRFTCTETARLADYDGSGRAKSDKKREYEYLLERGSSDVALRELRQRRASDGTLKRGAVEDEETFPPAYAWVFLFSEFNQGFFSYRDLGDRFEGFDWVREIQFRGAVSFTDGRDIRQWEGTVLVDAVTLTPIEVHAQPTNQDERILAQYRRFNRAFNLIGFRLAPRPIGHRSEVHFRLRRDGLTFPTQLRYDTFRAVAPDQSRPMRASTRFYDNYLFFKTGADEERFDTPSAD